jgi:hypothetical protein
MTGMAFTQALTDSPTDHISPQHARVLWHAFTQRVEPFVRIMYELTRNQLRARSIDVELQASLSTSEKALVAAVHLASINSLTNEDCQSDLAAATTLDPSRQVPRSVRDRFTAHKPVLHNQAEHHQGYHHLYCR